MSAEAPVLRDETYPPAEYWEHIHNGGDFATAATFLHPVPKEDEQPAILRHPPALPDPTADDEPTGPPDIRPQAIIPAPFGGTRRMDKAKLPLFEVGVSRPPFEPHLLGSLPAAQGTHRTKPWHGIPEIMVPEILVKNGPHNTGDSLRVAPAGLRLFLELLMFVPRQHRRTPYRLRLRVADLAECLWPDGRYRPDRHGRILSHALVVAHNCRLPWSNDETDGYWAPVVVRLAPEVQHLDSAIVVDVELPPGSHAGPMVYRPTLRRYGAKSALAWRLTLALTWLWDHYLTGRHAPGMERLPWLDHDALVRLATGRDISRVRKKQRKRALLLRTQQAVDRLHDDNNVRVEVDPDTQNIRLLPPADWRQR